MKYLAAIALGIVATVFGGYVLHILWNWYMVSAFNLNKLTIEQATGLLIVSWIFTVTQAAQSLNKQLDEDAQVWAGPLISILLYAFLLITGALYSIILL